MVHCLGLRIEQLEAQKESESDSSDSDGYEPDDDGFASENDDEGYHEIGSN
jgi:hypothetical protein